MRSGRASRGGRRPPGPPARNPAIRIRALTWPRGERGLPMLNDTSAPSSAIGNAGFRTTCGRDVRVGRLALGGAERPAWRVSLDVGRSPGRDDGSWAGLTPAEARRLAAALLAQAAAADSNAGAGAAGPAGPWRGGSTSPTQAASRTRSPPGATLS